MQATTTIAALIADMQSAGYRRGVPARSPYTAIDAEVCAESRCEQCGQLGLSYVPFTKSGSYVAYAHCPNCGKASEF